MTMKTGVIDKLLAMYACTIAVFCAQYKCQQVKKIMNLVSVILLLASISTISSTVAGQCDYVYIAQPPRPELICNPHAINQLRLVCSIFVADISQPDNLTVQWIFGVPTAEGQFDPNNLFEFRQASINFTVVPREIFTSRLEVVPVSKISSSYNYTEYPSLIVQAARIFITYF